MQNFNSALPELRSLLETAPHKPRVRFYEGKKNILSLYETEICCATDIIGVVSMKDIRKILIKEEEMGILHLIKYNGGHIRDLLEDSPEAREYLEEKNRLNLGETKFLSSNMQFAVDIIVYENTVAMISPKNMIAVLIEDPAIAAAQKQFLDFLWGNLSVNAPQ